MASQSRHRIKNLIYEKLMQNRKNQRVNNSFRALYNTHYTCSFNKQYRNTNRKPYRQNTKRNVENYATYKTMKNIKIKKYSKNLFKSFIFVHIKANANTNTIQLYISTEYTKHK